MALDIQSPKVTWAAIYVIAGLVFSTGMAWNKILIGAETNSKQWNFINKNGADYESLNKYIYKVDAISRNLPNYERSTADLNIALTDLTAVMRGEIERRRDDDAQRVRDRELLQKVADDMTVLKVKIGRLDQQLNSSK